jgi:hypothetical protein
VRCSQEEEMAQCTFTPRTIPLPAFLQRMASAHAASAATGVRRDDTDTHAQPWL